MDRDVTLDAISKVLRSVARHYTAEIALDTSLALDIGLDSVDLIELTNALEDAFAADIPIEATVGVHTVGDIVHMLSECGAGSAHAS